MILFRGNEDESRSLTKDFKKIGARRGQSPRRYARQCQIAPPQRRQLKGKLPDFDDGSIHGASAPDHRTDRDDRVRGVLEASAHELQPTGFEIDLL